jgi:hypothetical protein
MTRLLLLLVAAGAASAAPPKLTAEPADVEPPADLKAPIRSLMSSKAVRVSDGRGRVCTIWLRPAIPAAREAAGYRAVVPTTVVGAVRFDRAWTDFHHQEIPAGTYTLRLMVQPESKDHEGTAPHRDVCVLTPAAADEKPDLLPVKKLIEQSGTATGGTHPVVMLLFPHPKPAAGATVTDRGKGIVTADATATTKVGETTKELGFAFVVRGVSGGE